MDSSNLILKRASALRVTVPGWLEINESRQEGFKIQWHSLGMEWFGNGEKLPYPMKRLRCWRSQHLSTPAPLLVDDGRATSTASAPSFKRRKCEDTDTPDRFQQHQSSIQNLSIWNFWYEFEMTELVPNYVESTIKTRHCKFLSEILKLFV